MSDESQINMKGLEQFIKAMKWTAPTARVGVLGSKDNRSRGDQTNAQIGRKHEYGVGIVRRSFLRMPITMKMQKYLNDSMAFDEHSITEIMKAGSLDPFVKKMGVLGEAIVAAAFDTGGFGQWQPSDMRYKKNQQTLVETQQLRNSISSEVVK